MHTTCPSCHEKIKFTYKERLYRNNFKTVCKNCGAILVVKKWSSYLYLMSLVLPVILFNIAFRDIDPMLSIVIILLFAISFTWFISPAIIRYRVKKTNEII